MKLKRIKPDPNLIIAVSVMIISLGALFVSYKQAAIMNKQTDLLLDQNRSASWPYLDLGDALIISDEDNRYRIFLSNKGNGPAIIEGVIITYKGKVVRTWKDLFEEIEIEYKDDQYVFSYSNISNTVISSGEDIDVFNISRLKSVNDFISLIKYLTIEIYYKSVFDEYWYAKNEGFKNARESKIVTRVEKIEFDKDANFLQ